MLEKFKIRNINFAITKYQRVRNYIRDLKENIKIQKNKDSKIIKEITNLIDNKIKHIKRIYIVLYFLYFGIYFSFFSIFFSDIFFLGEFAILIGKIVGFFGTTFFLILIYFTNKIIDLYYQDLNLLTSHIISIYMDNRLQNEKNSKNESKFNVFIDFFKKRGFW